jgi:hypothetical protein
MPEKKPTRDGNSRPEEIIDNMREKSSRSVDEIARTQESEVQQLSELQKEAAGISKKVVIATAENHKEHAAATATGTNPVLTTQVSEQVTDYSDEITDNFKNFTRLYSKLAMNALDVTQENARLYGKAIDTLTNHNLNMLNTWISYWTGQPQRGFSKT